MLKFAKDRNCYDDLHEGDLITILNESDITYDLFSATDVLIYIGDLDELFATIMAKAKPDALFIFSTETYESEGFILQRTGRYAHSRQYIQTMVRKYGNSIIAEKHVPLRKEFKEWIMGDLYIIRLHS
jgi:predicted TPR repeat methyltransferase